MSRALDPERVLSLLSVAGVQGGYLTVREAASLLGVAPDDVPGLVGPLSMLEVPPFESADAIDVSLEGEWLEIHPPPALTELLNFSPVDCALLLACLDAVRPGLDQERQRRCDRLSKRLQGVLVADVATDATRRADSLAWSVDAPSEAELAEVLYPAVAARRLVVLRYYNASRDVLEERRVRPYRVVEHGGRWYLSAADDLDGRHRHWRLDRLHSVRATDETFARDGPEPERFRRDVLFDAPPRTVAIEVRFAPEAIERATRWFARRAGSIRQEGEHVRMTISAPTEPVFFRELLRFGEGWQIVGPEGVPERMVAFLQRAAGAPRGT